MGSQKGIRYSFYRDCLRFNWYDLGSKCMCCLIMNLDVASYVWQYGSCLHEICGQVTPVNLFGNSILPLKPPGVKFGPLTVATDYGPLLVDGSRDDAGGNSGFQGLGARDGVLGVVMRRHGDHVGG